MLAHMVSVVCRYVWVIVIEHVLQNDDCFYFIHIHSNWHKFKQKASSIAQLGQLWEPSDFCRKKHAEVVPDHRAGHSTTSGKGR